MFAEVKNHCLNFGYPYLSVLYCVETAFDI